jgi:hypothetical protein
MNDKVIYNLVQNILLDTSSQDVFRNYGPRRLRMTDGAVAAQANTLEFVEELSLIPR